VVPAEDYEGSVEGRFLYISGNLESQDPPGADLIKLGGQILILKSWSDFHPKYNGYKLIRIYRAMISRYF
jgi:hypothetical protein